MLRLFRWILVGILAVMLPACNDNFSDEKDQQDISTATSVKPKKTGQAISYANYDDAYYQKGIEPRYSRDDYREVVVDDTRGLMWQDDVSAKSIHKQWHNTKDYCNRITLGGYKDWRMPTSKELEDIVDYAQHKPAINPVFYNTAYGLYWTSDKKDNGDAWAVSFEYGSVIMRLQSFAFYIRCVRGI